MTQPVTYPCSSPGRSGRYELTGPAPAVSTFIVTWNPRRWAWDDRDEAVARTATGEVYDEQWSVGGRRSGMQDGDMVYLLKQGPEPRGIVASGVVRSSVWQDDHWDGTPGKVANYVDIDWERVVDDGDILATQTLEAEVTAVNWTPQGGGITIDRAAAPRVAELWDHLGDTTATPAIATNAERRLAREAGYVADAAVRRAIEDHAVAITTTYYCALGFDVEDVGQFRPYDLHLTHRSTGEERHVEVKGTAGAGDARGHRRGGAARPILPAHRPLHRRSHRVEANVPTRRDRVCRHGHTTRELAASGIGPGTNPIPLHGPGPRGSGLSTGPSTAPPVTRHASNGVVFRRRDQTAAAGGRFTRADFRVLLRPPDRDFGRVDVAILHQDELR